MKLTHYQFNPANRQLQQSTVDAYAQRRSHAQRDVKERFDTREIDAPAIVHAWAAAASASPRQYVINQFPHQVVKIIGWNPGVEDQPATTGTSKIDTACLTHGMEICVAVAVGGERIGPDLRPMEGARVRIFHVRPSVQGATEKGIAQVGRYAQALQAQGLQVRAALEGAGHGATGLGLVRGLLGVLRDCNVPIEFDHTSSESAGTPLGVVILPDHSVKFVTNVVALESP